MSSHPQQSPDWGADRDPQPQSSFDFVGMLQRRFWIIVLCLIFATGGGVFWYWKSPVKYSSVARTHIYFTNPNISIVGNDGFTTTNSIQSHDELFKSETVLRKTAEEILRNIQNGSITKNPEDIPGDEAETGTPDENLEATDRTTDTAGEQPFAQLRDMTVGQIVTHLMKSVDVVQDRNDKNIYQISYTGSNRRDCHVILGKIIKNYEAHLTSKYENEGQKLLDNIKAAQRRIHDDLRELNSQLDHWRNDVHKADFERYADGILITKEGKTNRYRMEAQELYKEISDLQKERDKISDDQKWIDSAIASKMSKQEILTHIDKFSDWLQIEQRKITSAKNSGAPLKLPTEFEEPEPPADLLEARFAVTQKQGEIQELIDKGFGANYPGRRSLERQLKELQARVKFLEEHHERLVEKARKKYDELKKLAETQENVDASELPKILNDIDLIGLHKSFLEQKLIRLDNDLAKLKTEYDAKMSKANALDVLLNEEKKMLNEIAMQESLNNTVLQKISEIEVEKDNGGYILDVINSPSYGRQTEPSMVKIFAITSFLGLVLGTGLAYLVEIADKTFRSPAEIAQQLGMQVIGHVPVLTTRKVNAKDSALDESLVAFHLPKSQQSEAFRAIRTALFFNAQGKNSQIIQVTSPTPGDGKSTLAANLAISLAQSGKQVLIVDADLRRPTVNHLFGIDSEIGFAAVLNDEADIDDAILESPEVDGLSVMPSGKRPSNPSELLTSSRLYDLFEVLREKYDFIIMDSPPLLAVTDPAAVAARVDGVLLALRIKKNVKLSASRAKEVLDSVGANIMGIVVNGAGMVQGTYSNSAAYGYGYGSGYGGSYYSYGYDYGESAYYYDEDSKATTARR